MIIKFANSFFEKNTEITNNIRYTNCNDIYKEVYQN